MKAAQVRVAAVVLMHGNRWKFLSQTIPAILSDEHITKLIIVDNGSENKLEIEEGTKQYGDRVTVLRVENNLGSPGGFSLGSAEVKKVAADFLYLSDDDMVPEENFVQRYLDARSHFRDGKVVICGNRVDVPGNIDVFTQPIEQHASDSRTFFSVFGWNKIKNFFDLVFGLQSRKAKGQFVPIVPGRGGFVYGGAFIPYAAVLQAPLPDAELFLYGDDIEYSWGIEALGYAVYVSSRPIIHDIDLTFGTDSHIFGLFRKDLPLFKVYYRMRNMVRLSVRHSTQPKIILLFSVIVWFAGLLVLGLLRYGPTPHYFRRARLIDEAVLGGYFPSRAIPKEAAI
jgi:GT2 family glycosyltransferase